MLGLFSGELIFRGACYWKEFCISKWVGLDNKTASTNSPWAYIWEGLLSEGYLRLRFGGLIFGGLIFWGGAYYRNFMLFILLYKTICRSSFRVCSVVITWLVKYGRDFKTRKDSSIEQIPANSLDVGALAFKI